MIPGLGGCKVQRDDLIFDLASTIETRPVPSSDWLDAELNCHRHGLRALAADLSEAGNPLSKIVRRLRIRVNDQCKGWKRVAGGNDFGRLPEDMKAILRMLTVNRHLAYLDVLMRTDHCKHGNALKKHHLKPIDRPAKLARPVKLAFLSFVSTRMTPAETC
ncbi:hypothetical protein PC129_g9283 [Phytophthora cactorum]|uniref:Uncharacterized protein n=1 Tax=Phytophthora cactorum TaxID=29920 RepID=A0A8T1I9V8_9STRA|nr:hypothetical protein C6341_g12748 [Phytophthora cactorum]KAG3219942.1 hypothetical protein PC129_g9283 [Phytophthora cactorum]KAG4050728.1 hypothetical protein PC123_g14031 [Phytophthora cactorum]KAG4234271.1 hypothetical protein PC116_g17569 [Phytophthora cactorum]